MNLIATTAAIVFPANARRHFQFRLIDLFGWTTYAAIAGALLRVEPLFAILFVLWVIPGILRYQAMLYYGRNTHTWLAHCGLLITCVMIEGSISLIAGTLMLMACCPLALFLGFLESTRMLGGWDSAGVTIFCLTLLAIYISAYEYFRRSTWPNKMLW